ncbi:hypothetical protein [Brachybacterium timonense]|uniref:hypothetical protein n=1 Tax=Brachybacterium timonense TaxID=2050896 RepID=UPI000D0BABE5|nr:hypothetical protein [Brachybacterium timonense]
MSGTDRDQHETVQVSALTVPLLLGGVVLGFLAGYFFVWWGTVVVLFVLMGAFSAAIAGRSRDAAAAAALGTVVGYVLVLLLGVFKGVI